MNTKTLLVVSVVANAVLAAAILYLGRKMPEPGPGQAGVRLIAQSAAVQETSLTNPADGSPAFGPVWETWLAKPGDDRRPEMFDLETGRHLQAPDFEFFGRDARAYVTWMQTHGLDVSGVIHEDGDPLCVGYYMAMVPVDSKRWKDASPAEVLAHADLARMHDPKWSVIVPAQAQTDTFLFRTHEGTTGVLQVLGATPDRHRVKIRYKLVQPAALASVPPVEVSAANRSVE